MMVSLLGYWDESGLITFLDEHVLLEKCHF